MSSFEIVIPTAGRPSLATLLAALRGAERRTVVVDDRTAAVAPLAVPTGVRIARGPARGPAAARNAGWRRCRADWVVFLDDDVEPEPGWLERIEADLAAAAPDVGGVQGRIVVPLPRDRRPTDWERNTAGLETARWATADMAYRRAALAAVGGFDERFPRAYREDADLGLRIRAAGWWIVCGSRTVRHPARPAPPWISLAKQAGNADDVLMRALHGRGWRERAGVPRGRRPLHVAVAAAGATALAGLAARRRGPAGAAGAVWAAGTAELARARIAPGPRTPREVATMLWTSALLPFAATGWWLAGLATLRRRLAGPGAPVPAPQALDVAQSAPPGAPAVTASTPTGAPTAPTGAPPRRADATPRLPAAVLFDRDGTLVVDVPYNGDPERVEPMPGAAEALARLRAAGVATAVVSNQSGIGRGLIGEDDVRALNARVEELLGPLGPSVWCPHVPGDGCACRKPAPGLILRAAELLGVAPERCVVIGDIGADIEAASAAGARAMLVPTPATRPEEVAAAPDVAPDLSAAIDRVLATRGALSPHSELKAPRMSATPLRATPQCPPFASADQTAAAAPDATAPETQGAAPDAATRRSAATEPNAAPLRSEAVAR